MSYLSDLLGSAYKEGMSEDEISSAIESVISTKEKGITSETERLKAALSKSNSEAADYKKRLREKQTAEETAAQEQKEQMDKLIADNKNLQRTISLTEKTSKLIAAGYSEEMAKETATALIDGNFDKFFENQNKFLSSQKETIEADLMRRTGRPSGGSVNTSTDYSKLIDAARTSGDNIAVAYYTRLQAQQSVEAKES